MPDDRSDAPCELLTKNSNGKSYYKCKTGTCTNECVLYVIWEEILGAGLGGVKQVIGQSVIEIGCECMKWPDNWSEDSTAANCRFKLSNANDVIVKGKKARKSYVGCVSHGCNKECVVVIQYQNPALNKGPIQSVNCACVDWDTL